MAYLEFENGVTPINDTNLNTMQTGLMQLVFPIGATYVTQSADTNPSTILNFGTWERVKGRVLVGIDEDDEDFATFGQEGGEKEHKQTLEELVSHAHGVAISGTNVGKAQSNMQTGGDFWNMAIGTTGNQSLSITSTGGGKPFNITQQYKVVGYMWIRTL